MKEQIIFAVVQVPASPWQYIRFALATIGFIGAVLVCLRNNRRRGSKK